MRQYLQQSAWSFATVAFAFGCAQAGDAANRSDARGDDRKFVVQVGEKTLASPQPAILNVTFDDAESAGMAELSWEVEEGTSLVLRVPYAELQKGRIDAELVTGPLAGDRATANLRVGGALAKDGTLSLTLSKGRLVGGADAEAVSFEGVLAVSCSVPEAVLAAGGEAKTDETAPDTAQVNAAQAQAPIPDDARAQPVLVDDLRFRSTPCARVKADFVR
jgi:hypothetical protein